MFLLDSFDTHGHHFFGTQPDAFILVTVFRPLPPASCYDYEVIYYVVDAGGAGWRNFSTFKEQTIDRSKTRVLSFLNIVGSGMQGGAIEQNTADMDSKLTAIVARDIGNYCWDKTCTLRNGFDWTPTERAVEAGKLAIYTRHDRFW